MIWDIIVL